MHRAFYEWDKTLWEMRERALEKYIDNKNKDPIRKMKYKVTSCSGLFMNDLFKFEWDWNTHLWIAEQEVWVIHLDETMQARFIGTANSLFVSSILHYLNFTFIF